MKMYKLPQNKNICFSGGIVNGKGFVLAKEKAKELIEKDSKNAEVIKNLLIGRDLNQRIDQSPSRMVIDFQDWSLEKAREYKDCFEIIEEKVKPVRALNRNLKLREKFWQFSSSFKNQRSLLNPLKKFIVTSRVSKYRFFNFVENKNVLAEGKVVYFPTESLAFLGILSSKFYVEWDHYFGAWRETRRSFLIESCFDCFPFIPTENETISTIMLELDSYRKAMCLKEKMGLTTLYTKMFEGKQPILKELHTQLDHAVAELYSFPVGKLNSKKEILKFLFEKNHDLAQLKK